MTAVGKFSPVLLIMVATAAVVAVMPATSQAGDPLGVDLACPTTMPSSGGTLTITLTLRNRTSTAKTVAKSALGVHLANSNILGPFIVPFSITLAPRANQVVPYVSTAFPAGTAPAGTLTSIGVTLLDNANKHLGGNFCRVQIL
jgi:hypothetical protein